MSIPLTPDVEAITAAYLRQRPAVTAIVGQRVGTRTPNTLDRPWVRLSQIHDEPLASSSALHLVAVSLQVDCYAGEERDTAQQQASLLARTVRAELHAMPGIVGAAVVSRATVSGMARMPDTDLQPARERYVFDAYLTVHP